MDENGTMASHRAVRTFQLVDIDCNMCFGSTCAAYRIQCMPPSSWIVSRRTRTWPVVGAPGMFKRGHIAIVQHLCG